MKLGGFINARLVAVVCVAADLTVEQDLQSFSILCFMFADVFWICFSWSVYGSSG